MFYQQIGKPDIYSGFRGQLEQGYSSREDSISGNLGTNYKLGVNLGVKRFEIIFGSNRKLWYYLFCKKKDRCHLWAISLARVRKGILVKMLRSYRAKESGTRVKEVNTKAEMRRIGKEIAVIKPSLGRDSNILAKQAQALQSLQSIWESRVATHVCSISNTFSVLLRSIHCNGELGLERGENEKTWGLKVKIGFRADGKLHLLDTQRQSGGERALTTVCFFLALHATSTAAIRLVDEINQGMDEFNERWTHAKIIQITSQGCSRTQYFLISPKLLQDLAYSEKAECHVIFTGDWVRAE